MSNDQMMDEGVWDTDKFELEDKAIRPSQWATLSSRVFKAVPSTHTTIKSGCYSVTLDRNDEKPIFMMKDIATDDIIRFKDSLADEIMEEIDRFWSSGDEFKEFGVMKRRGYLLYGPQGTGKSSVVQQIIVDVIKRGGIVLVCDNPKYFAAGLATIRQVEPKRQIVCVFEDIDAIIKRYGEDQLLSVLDGSDKISDVLNIATTNYPEHLDKRIISRPRRFDRVIKILAPDVNVRKAFFQVKLPKSEQKNIVKWVADTDGMSFASLTELIISVFCLGNKYEHTLKVLKDIEGGHPNSDDFGVKKQRPGFGGTSEDDEED